MGFLGNFMDFGLTNRRFEPQNRTLSQNECKVGDLKFSRELLSFRKSKNIQHSDVQRLPIRACKDYTFRTHKK